MAKKLKGDLHALTSDLVLLKEGVSHKILVSPKGSELASASTQIMPRHFRQATECEDFFSEFVLFAGGKRYTDVVTVSRGEENADFVFPDHRFVVELKQFDSDRLGDMNIGTKVLEHPDTSIDLKATFDSTAVVRLSSLSRSIIERAAVIRIRPLINHLSKSNSQLLQAKIRLPQFRTMTLLINNTDRLITPNFYRHAISQHLSTSKALYKGTDTILRNYVANATRVEAAKTLSL